MKIMKIIGIVAGIHALFFLLLFAVPGCSSTSKAPVAQSTSKKEDAPAPAAKADAATPAIALTVPAPAAPVEEGLAPAITFSPTRPNTPTEAALVAQPVSDVVSANTYTVVSGDNLWMIAKKNHLKVSELAAANNMKTSSSLRVGQKLLIPTKPEQAATAAAAPTASAPASAAPAPKAAASAPASSTKYTVKSGESLGAIARKFHVRLSELAIANSISDPKNVHPGQVLIIPASARATKAAPVPAPTIAIPAISTAPEAAPAASPAAEVPTIQIQPAPAN
jgi:LysM repeat protein